MAWPESIRCQVGVRRRPGFLTARFRRRASPSEEADFQTDPPSGRVRLDYSVLRIPLDFDARVR